MLELTGKECFDEVYKIMEESFPVCERRSRERQLALFEDGKYRAAVKRNGDGKICAFMLYWVLEGATFLEHFAVDKNLRGAGLGGAFLDELLKELSAPVVLEVELPETEIAERRIQFYGRHGFVLNPYDYMQPALTEGGKPVPLKIMSHASTLSRGQFKAISSQIYADVYKTTFGDICK